MDSRDEIMVFLKEIASNKTRRVEDRMAAIQAMASISLRDMFETKLETIIESLDSIVGKMK